MQHGNIISYTSINPMVHEMNYLTHDLKFDGVEYSFKIWRNYLYGIHVVVFIDHKRLRYVFIPKYLNLQQIRWLELLKDYDMSVIYHSSKDNVVADSLSRMTMASVTHVE